MSDTLEENNRDKLYIWISETTNDKKDIVEGNNIFISQRMGERGRLFRAKVRWSEGKKILQRRRYILMSCVIDGDTQLHDLGGLAFSYI